jgi:hypothetical protein
MIAAGRRLASALALCTALAAGTRPECARAQSPASASEARFASELGLGLSGPPAIAPSPQGGAGFAGAAAAPCASIDLHRFLQAFDPHELLDELRDSLTSGAQSAVSNYLLALAYSAPTLVSVLDMTDKTLAGRFSSFARSCAMQHDTPDGAPEARQRLSQAARQCFALQVGRGVAPTEALRRCATGRPFDGLALPAMLPTAEFLRRYTQLALTPHTEALLALLPDGRIQDGAYQVRPPRLSLASLIDRWQVQARSSLDLIDGGEPASALPDCALDHLLDAGSEGRDRCLPPAAQPLVTSAAYRGTRLLDPAAREIFKDALAGQIAMVQATADLLDLSRQVATIGLRPGAGAGAEDLVARQAALSGHTRLLLEQLDLRARLQQSRAALARMQVLALQRAQDGLRNRASTLAAERGGAGFGLHDILPIFQDRR